MTSDTYVTSIGSFYKQSVRRHSPSWCLLSISESRTWSRSRLFYLPFYFFIIIIISGTFNRVYSIGYWCICSNERLYFYWNPQSAMQMLDLTQEARQSPPTLSMVLALARAAHMLLECRLAPLLGWGKLVASSFFVSTTTDLIRLDKPGGIL